MYGAKNYGDFVDRAKNLRSEIRSFLLDGQILLPQAEKFESEFTQKISWYGDERKKLILSLAGMKALTQGYITFENFRDYEVDTLKTILSTWGITQLQNGSSLSDLVSTINTSKVRSFGCHGR